MISEKLLNGLNEQIKHEFDAANIYLSMAAYFKSEDLDGFAHFFLQQVEEERFHAMKFFDFIDELGKDILISGLDNPINSFNSPLEVFEAALDHEKKVTSLINDLMGLAVEEKNYATVQFLGWFIEEQMEEEATFSGLVAKIKRIQDNPSALYMLDNELGQRTFDPSAE